MIEFIKNLTIGGWVGLFVALSTLVEIVPVKVYPIQWLGNRLNSGISKRMDALERVVYEHIAQGYRDKIMDFQNGLLINGYSFYTQEQYDEVIDACEYYEEFCKKNEIQNDKCKLAIQYIRMCYQKCQTKRTFANLPTN